MTISAFFLPMLGNFFDLILQIFALESLCEVEWEKILPLADTTMLSETPMPIINGTRYNLLFSVAHPTLEVLPRLPNA